MFRIDLFCRVGGLREKEYQLAAQKKNNAFLKFDYHQRTARYFERECEIAQRFNSWSTQDQTTSQTKSYLKADKLRRRQSALKRLLAEEEEVYGRELNDLKARNETSEDKSIDRLKDQLREKQAEISLYFPRDRLFRSFEPEKKSKESYNGIREVFEIDLEKKTGDQRQKGNSFLKLRETGNKENMASNGDNSIENRDNRATTAAGRHFSGEEPLSQRRHMKNIVRSLEETNLRDHFGEKQDDGLQGAHVDFDSQGHEKGDKDYRVDFFGEKRHAKSQGDYQEHYEESTGQKRHMENHERTLEETNLRDHFGEKQDDGHQGTHVDGTGFSGHEKGQDDSKESLKDFLGDQGQLDNAKRSLEETDMRYDLEEKEDSDKDSFGYGNNPNDCLFYAKESGKSTPNPGKAFKDISEGKWKSGGLFSSPENEEKCPENLDKLKLQIQDLAQREVSACRKQCWTEALRLRQMRNHLEIQKETELLERDDFQIDERTRQSGLGSIENRKLRLRKREEELKNRTLQYDEDAKSLWEAHVREDEKVNEKVDEKVADGILLKEILLNELQEEWNDLRSQDKEKQLTRDQQKAALQSEMEITAEAFKQSDEPVTVRAKSPCTLNKEKNERGSIFF